MTTQELLDLWLQINQSVPGAQEAYDAVVGQIS